MRIQFVILTVTSKNIKVCVYVCVQKREGGNREK